MTFGYFRSTVLMARYLLNTLASFDKIRLQHLEVEEICEILVSELSLTSPSNSSFHQVEVILYKGYLCDHTRVCWGLALWNHISYTLGWTFWLSKLFLCTKCWKCVLLKLCWCLCRLDRFGQSIYTLERISLHCGIGKYTNMLPDCPQNPQKSLTKLNVKWSINLTLTCISLCRREPQTRMQTFIVVSMLTAYMCNLKSCQNAPWPAILSHWINAVLNVVGKYSFVLNGNPINYFLGNFVFLPMVNAYDPWPPLKPVVLLDWI